MKLLLQTILTVALMFSFTANASPLEGFAPLTEPQSDHVHETARNIVTDHLAENQQEPSKYLARYEECAVFDGLVAVDIFYAEDAKRLKQSRGNPSGLSRTFWIDVDERKVVREAYWQ